MDQYENAINFLKGAIEGLEDIGERRDKDQVDFDDSKALLDAAKDIEEAVWDVFDALLRGDYNDGV